MAVVFLKARERGRISRRARIGAIDDSAQPANDRPSVILLGIGHSGTSIIAGMMFELGWQRNDADAQFNESVSIRDINDKLLRGESCLSDMRDTLGGLRPAARQSG